MTICQTHAPGYTPVGPGHQAACWLLQQEAITQGETPVLRPEFKRTLEKGRKVGEAVD